jgi:hypothetical protein
MNTPPDASNFPDVSAEEVQQQLPKRTAILLRLSLEDKKSITTTARSLKLTATEYLVKCHHLVSSKLPPDTPVSPTTH